MMDLEFDPVPHTYKLNKRAVPSVSRVLEPLQDFSGIPEEVLEHARQRGQAVHDACYRHDLGGLVWDSLDWEVEPFVRAYLAFLEDSKFVTLASEVRIASPKYGYAGTLDRYGIFTRGEAMLDIKATAALPRTVGAQCAAYQQALLETTGQKSKRRYCLHLRPDAYKLIEVTDGPGIQDFTLFLSCLNIWKWRNAGA